MTRHAKSLEFVCPQRRIVAEHFAWNDITLLVSFEADWLGRAAGRAAGRLEERPTPISQVLAPRGAPLPVSDDVYWSAFLGLGEVEDAGGPVALAASILDEFADTQTWRVRLAKWEDRDG